MFIRRKILKILWLMVVSFCVGAEYLFAAAPNAPLTPLCEGEENPVGVTNSMPEFSWTFSDDDVEDSQSAYQILVAAVEVNLSTGPYMWDSGKTLSSTSSATYNGSTLLWNTTYYWKVRTWDRIDSTGVYCSTQTFKTGLFLLKESSAESDATWSIGLGDLNNDGKLDYIAGNEGSANRIYINTTGTFTLKESSTETNATRCICIGDLNNDGNLDYIAGNASESYGDRIYKNTGGGSFSILQEIAEKELTQCNCLGDIDNDGDLDYVSRNMSNQPTRVYKNTGDGNFSLFQDLATTGDSYNGGMALADIDADGDLDLLCGRTGIYKNTGEGNFTLYSSIGGNGIAVGDIDNDGDLDCIRVWAYTANWCKNDGSGNFQIGSDFDAGLYRDNIAVSLGDIDNDGDLDVIVGADYPTPAFIGGSVIYLNEGNFNFSLLEKSSIKERVFSVGFGDIDNDGDLDYISANRGGKNRIYKSGWVDIGNNANTAPSAPTTFNSRAIGGKVQLTWNAGTDTKTPANGLYYNIRVGTVSLSSNIVSGIYGSPLLGNYIRPTISTSTLGLNLLKMKDETTYYWSVQTIDTGLAKSSWSTEQSVYLPLNYPPNAPLSPLCNFPKFSWTFSDNNAGDEQTAYQILVSSVEEYLESGPYIWDSDKVRSAEKSCIYPEINLAWRTTYYWKVRTWDTADSSSLYCDNQTFYIPEPGLDTNIALNKPTAASSVTQYDSSIHGHEKAVDGNISTRWSSYEPASQTEWIWVDLGYKYKINKVVIYWQEAYANSYKIQVSTDCTNWEDVYYTDSGDGGTDEIIFESEVYGRYVRMYGLHIGYYGYSIWEMEVYSGVAPEIITNLTAITGVHSGEINLSWTAPGNDGTQGDIVNGKYTLQYATYSVSWSTYSSQGYRITWNTSTVAQASQSKIVTGLTSGNTYYFHLWTADESYNWSSLSNEATAMAQLSIIKIELSPSTYNFGILGTAQTTVSNSSITVTNSGTLLNTYKLQCTTSTPTGWIPVTTNAPTNNAEFRMLAIFNKDTKPGINDFNPQKDWLFTSDHQCNIDELSGNENGVNVDVGESRGLWFRLETPTGVPTSIQQTVTVTLTAAPE